MTTCPICSAENESNAFVCGSCRTILTLSDMEMLLSRTEADRETLLQVIEAMEAEKKSRHFSPKELKNLAIGQINLKNLRAGVMHLQKAAQMTPNDVMLASQVNFLKIRLSEIEQQEMAQSSMSRGRKILIVDDSATVRKLISSKLEKSGHEVVCAVDGIDALEKVKECVPDLILLDIMMPQLDGYQVCKLIRTNESTKDVPIVMISGKDGFFDKVRGRMAGTTGYITKPFGPETLMKTIETYIAHRGEMITEEEVRSEG
jgi:twitching motility two-component system response regulator PilG